MIRVGIIGAGSMGNAHASCISLIQGVKIVAVADKIKDSAESLANKFNAKVFNSDDLINSKDVDVVYVCLPTSAHAEYVIKSANAGKYVFVEKPLARTLEEGREMIRTTRKTKVKFMVGHILRFFPEYVKIKEILDKGSVGVPCIARTTRARTSPGGWYLNIEHGAGVVLDFIIHDIDFLRWCFGDAKRVYAKGLIYRKLPNNIDYTLVTIRFKNGAIAHVEGSWAHSLWRTRVEIAGDKGLINFDSNESVPLKIELSENKKVETWTESPIAESPLLLENKHFFDCINLNKEPLTSGEESYKSLEISLSALDSIKNNRVVSIG